MKYTGKITTLVGVLVSAHTTVAQECVSHGFLLEFTGTCDYETVLEAYTRQVYNMSSASSCAADAAADLQKKLDDAGMTVEALCKAALDASEKVPFTNAAKRGTDLSFEQHFYNGRTDWQEEVETIYDSEDESATSILRRDAQQVKGFYQGAAQGKEVTWPGSLTNFQSSVTDANGNPTCETNTAMCCWPKDRQAHDNNGNCAKPYDTNCVNKKPGDNTNLCHVDLDRGASSNEYGSELGLGIYPKDDSVGEGAIHCHGLAWSNDANDTTARYKANNLFFVSMYDHMHQRGYVENIPGAPMCGCVEQMPTVSRSDCTQVDVTESYRITYDASTSALVATLTHIDVDFIACQGINNRNNDLWAYIAQLYRQGDISSDQFGKAGRIITDNKCSGAEQYFLMERGYSRGYEHDTTKFTQVIGRDSLSFDTYGPEAFNTVLGHGDADPVLLRVCIDCVSTHQMIYYRRLTEISENFSLLYNIAYENNNGDGNNVWGQDFTMHSTLEDATSGENPWMCPGDSYNYGARFPGECSPSGARVRNQGSAFSSGNSLKHVGYYVYRPEAEGLQVVPSDAVRGKDWAGGQALEAADGTIYLTGSGRDIWDSLDDFNFYSHPLDGDHTLTVKISSFRSPQFNQWMKAGLMIRKSLDPSSPYAGIFLTGSNGFCSFVRTGARYGNPNNLSTETPGSCVHQEATSGYVRLEKRLNTYNFHVSLDGTDWQQIATFDAPLIGDSYLGGLALTSKHYVPAEAVFEDFDIDRFYFPSAAPSSSPAPTIYAPGQDIGSVGIAGTATSKSDGSWKVVGSGSDIWGRSDQFHYVNFQKSGDVTVTMKITDFDGANADQWSKAGIMFRDTLDPSSAFFGIYTTGYSGIANQWRSSYRNGAGNSNTASKNTYDIELKVTKVGTSMSAYYKIRDAKEWTQQGLARTLTFSADDNFYVGIAVTSHNNLHVATLQAENFVIT